MIKNERQYRITKAQAEKFERTLEQLIERKAERGHLDPILAQAEENGLRSILADLQAQIEEYIELKSGSKGIFQCKSFLDLPKALIQARIASNLSQKQLAERLGVKPQQVQHYEATKYAGASFVRLQETMSALNVQVSAVVTLPSTNGTANHSDARETAIIQLAAPETKSGVSEAISSIREGGKARYG